MPFAASSRAASVRLRCLLPAAWLSAHGCEACVTGDPLSGRFDVVIFSKRYDAAARETARQLKARDTRVILDLCDNHFYNDSADERLAKRRDDLLAMIDSVDLVTVSTPALAEVVRNQSPSVPGIVVVPDPLEDLDELARRAPLQEYAHWPLWLLWRARVRLLRNRNAVGLVWFGNHGVDYSQQGGMSDLVRIRSVLERLSRHYPLYLSIISNNHDRFAEVTRGWSIPCLYLPWRALYFGKALRAHQIAVIPVENNPFTMCKTANRLALSLAQNLAVVADAIPSYEAFRDVAALDDWASGLERYLKDPAARARDAAAGADRVAREFSPGTVAEAWLDAVRTTLELPAVHTRRALASVRN